MGGRLRLRPGPDRLVLQSAKVLSELEEAAQSANPSAASGGPAPAHVSEGESDEFEALESEVEEVESSAAPAPSGKASGKRVRKPTAHFAQSPAKKSKKPTKAAAQVHLTTPHTHFAHMNAANLSPFACALVVCLSY